MGDDTDSRPRRSGVQSIEIGGSLLEAMIALGRPAPLSEIAKAADLQPAKAHRYLTSLGEIGLTIQNVEAGHYGLGPLALRLGLAAISQNDIIERAYEVLVDLCKDIRTSGHLSVWSEAGPIVIRSTHGGMPVISPVSVGTVLPLTGSASGHIYLAYMPEATTAGVLDKQGLSDAPDPAHMASIRDAGCAFADGQYIPGLRAMALPIINHDGVLAGAVTLVSTDEELFDKNGEVAAIAQEAMAQLHRNWSI